MWIECCSDTTGLIPARAGNTDMPVSFRDEGGAHPRSRGEHVGEPQKNDEGTGSSPLARGTQVVVVVEFGVGGLIPARAGNTDRLDATGHMMRAHPRSRGEHSYSFCCRFSGRGSSPLARGTQAAAVVNNAPAGLIPARAGNTLIDLPAQRTTGAHPRSRGEH